MKVVILAGGFGTRLQEYAKTIPKPMVRIVNKPILIHIMSHYAKYGFKDFVIASGYKKEVIKKYFKKKFLNWNVEVVDTGLNTMTGGRLKRLKKFINQDTFLMTYGDGLSDVNLKKLIKFHKKNKAIATLTAVRPPARFGVIKLSGNKVNVFREKSSLDSGWINGGFFVLEPEILNYIKNDKTFFEKEPLKKVSELKKLFAFKHKKFWHCMDTLRDKLILEKILKSRFKKKL